MSSIPIVIQCLSGHGGAVSKSTIQKRSLSRQLYDAAPKDLQHNVREFSEAVKRHRLAMNTEKNSNGL